jgi:hypothetical protein
VSAGRVAAAQAISRRAREQAARHRHVYRALVQRPKPLRVELMSNGLVLDEDEEEIDTSWTVDQYHEQVGLARGDIVLVMREDDDWIAFDVRAAK